MLALELDPPLNIYSQFLADDIIETTKEKLPEFTVSRNTLMDLFSKAISCNELDSMYNACLGSLEKNIQWIQSQSGAQVRFAIVTSCFISAIFQTSPLVLSDYTENLKTWERTITKPYTLLPRSPLKRQLQLLLGRINAIRWFPHYDAKSTFFSQIATECKTLAQTRHRRA